MIARDDAKATAAFDIEMAKVEREQKKLLFIDDHVLCVIAHKIVRGTRHRYAFVEQVLLQLAQVFFAAVIGEGDERMDKDAALGRPRERLLNFALVKAKNHDFDAFASAVDGFDQRANAITRLDD